MAIERSLTEGPLPIMDVAEEAIEIEIINPESVSVETEDGGMLIDLDPDSFDMGDIEFGANLAEYMEETELLRVSSDLVGSYNSDRNSRKDWEETYTKGLEQLGLKIEDRTQPWDGACGVTHPILSESVIRFQSQAMGEIFPASGPVRTKIMGKMDTEKSAQAHRVQDYMNYLVTEVMEEYRPETEKLLFSLPLAGSAFRKVYWDPTMERPCAMFVPSEDLVVSYGASSLSTCERATHVMKRNKNDIRKMQVSGFYLDVELGDSSESLTNIQEKYNKLTGESAGYQSDSRYTILEMHVDIDLPGFEDEKNGEPTGVALPYVVTIEEGSEKILSIRRNWFEDDEKQLRRKHFVHYEYLPGLGFYGFGLIHMIGGLAKSATSLLRQLVDAGTLSNLPGGLKSRGLRIKGDDAPIAPGEFRDVDVPGGAIRDNITFLPYKEPSGVLYQLLGNIVEEGRRFASLTDIKVSDMSGQAPVGTTLAIMERSMKVMSAIQARLHASMRTEFRILERIVRDHAPHEYPYDLSGNEVMKAEDFDDRIDVIPVSDPGSATMAQRIMQYQAALQLASTAPQMYNMPRLHRQMLEVLGIDDPDQVIPLEDEIPSTDPVTENMNILNGSPAKAFAWQDHAAHIQTHMSTLQDPKVQQLAGQAPNAQQIHGALMAHIIEHVAMQYRREIEQQLGTELPPIGEPLPDDVEVQISKLVAQASQQLLQSNQNEQSQQQSQQQAQDPIIQMRQRELQIREQEAQNRANEATEKNKIREQDAQHRASEATEKNKQSQLKLVLEAAKAADRGQIDKDKIETDARSSTSKVVASLLGDILSAEAQEAGRKDNMKIEDAKLQARKLEKITEVLMKATEDQMKGQGQAEKVLEDLTGNQ